MITIEEYRKKVKTKRKQLRNWVWLFGLFILSIITTILLSQTKSDKHTYLSQNIVLKDSEIIVNITDIDLSIPDVVLSKILESSKGKFSNKSVKILLNSKLISYYSLENPEISVLNAKREQNLAMNVSLKLLREGFAIRNYGNYETIEKSIILNRTPNTTLISNLSDKLKITNISNFIYDPSLKDNLAGIIVILGKDFDLKKIKGESPK